MSLCDELATGLHPVTAERHSSGALRPGGHPGHAGVDTEESLNSSIQKRRKFIVAGMSSP